MKFLFKKIPPKYFILSQIIIFLLSLIFLLGIHYIVNIQYKISDKPFSLGPVTSKPKSFTLNLDQGDDGLTYESQMLISGKTGPNMEILIFTNTDNLIIKSKIDGTFSTSLELEEGVNNIKVIVFDTMGDFREETRTVYYSEERI